MKDAYQIMVEKHQKEMERLLADWKTSDEKYKQRIEELEDNSEINRKAYEGLYIDYVKRGNYIAELQADNEGLERKIADLQEELREAINSAAMEE